MLVIEVDEMSSGDRNGKSPDSVDNDKGVNYLTLTGAKLTGE